MTVDTNHITEAPWILVPQHFGSLVYGVETSAYLPFDNAATTALRRLASEPLQAVVQTTSEPAARSELLNFHDRFHKLGFFTIDGRFAGRLLQVDPPADHLTGPLTVHLEVTTRCNLACQHCFAREPAPVHPKEPLGLHDLDNLFADMAALGSFRLGLTGGEPLLRPDLLPLLDLAIGHGLSPCLATNGLLLTEELAAALGQRRLAWLNVSLDGATPTTHDAIRGPGTFARVVERLAILRKHTRFSLAFTVMRHNLHEIRACARLARNVGAQAAVFRPLYPVGEARRHADLHPSFQEYKRAIASLADMAADTHCAFLNAHPWGPQTRQESQSVVFSHFGCGAGNLVCSISACGTVYPCSFLGERFAAGNVKDSSLGDIWHRSDVFRRMRTLQGPSRCQACAEFTTCGGGCRARAIAAHGSIEAHDPWCSATRN